MRTACSSRQSPAYCAVSKEVLVVDKKTVSFMRSLCMGQIEEDVILPFPTISRRREGDAARRGQLARAAAEAAREGFPRLGSQRRVPAEFIEELKSFGLFSFVIPEEHGGLGFGSERLLARAAGGRQIRRFGRGHGRRAQLDRHARAALVRHRRAEGALPARSSPPAR